MTVREDSDIFEQAQFRLEREADDARDLADAYGLEYVDVTRFRIDNNLFRSVPFDLMLRYLFIPESREGGRLSIVAADPTDVVKIDDELTITAGLRRRSLVVPRRMAPLPIASARLEGSSLVVSFARGSGGAEAV